VLIVFKAHTRALFMQADLLCTLRCAKRIYWSITDTRSFVKTSKLSTTADHLRSLHKFNEEPKETVGAEFVQRVAGHDERSLYMYDPGKGREAH
jgi:hypothetical protein